MARPIPVLAAILLGLGMLGFALGVAAAFAHARTVEFGSRLPIGLVLAVAALAGVTLCAGILTRSRLGAGSIALGWVISVIVCTTPRAEGDIVIAANVIGYSYLLVGVFVLAVLIAVPYRAGGARDR